MYSSPRKILIVEDEKSLARALELKLSSSGFKVRVAKNGQEALDFLKSNKFDLVLLDLIMPVMSGFDVLEKMRKNNDKTPVVVTSNLGQEEDLEKVKKLGVLNYFVKSDVSIVDIIKYIKENLK
jgi:DNA-binding response OmpR family regulator